MKVHFVLLSLMFSLTVQAQEVRLSPAQEDLLKESHQLATNKDTNTRLGYFITHQELNQIIKRIMSLGFKTKDILPIYQEAQRRATPDELISESAKENSIRIDIAKAWGMIFSIRVTMDSHEMSPRMTCQFKPTEKALDAVSEDSIQRHPERFELDAKTIQELTIKEDERLIVAVCKQPYLRVNPVPVPSTDYDKPEERDSVVFK